MKLSLWSLLFSILSYVILGVLRRSEFVAAGTPLGTMGLIMFLLVLLSAGIGIVFGVLSWKRKEGHVLWAIGAITFNIVMALAGVNFVRTD